MSKAGLPLKKAQRIAQGYLRLLAPYCERIEIAGSIRRRAASVGDIEMVAVPRLVEGRDLFGEPFEKASLLDDGVVDVLIVGADARLLKGGKRYKQIALREGLNLDLFVVRPPAQWGVIFTLRTGPSDFSKWIVTPRRRGGALPSDCRVKSGAVWRGGEILPMPEEEDFLKFLGLSGLPPEARKAGVAFTL